MIAVYVSAIVTANTVSTVVAGRTRLIALLRLIGSSARSQRAQIAREGLLVGVAGAAIGVVAGTGVAFALDRVAVANDLMPATDYDYPNPWVVLPAVAVVLTTWLASWVGSRRVLRVRPIQAIGNANEHDREELGRRRGRNVTALVLLRRSASRCSSLGVVLGLVAPYGVLVGMVGGIVSFTGIVLGADVVMPPVLRLVGRVLGSVACGPPRGRERRAPPRAQLADDDRPRHRRDPRDDVLGDDGRRTATMILAAQRAQPEVYAGHRRDAERHGRRLHRAHRLQRAHRCDRHGEHAVAERHAAHPRARPAAGARLRPSAVARHDRRRERRPHARRDGHRRRARIRLRLGGRAVAARRCAGRAGARAPGYSVGALRRAARRRGRRSRSSRRSPRHGARCGSRRWSPSRSSSRRARA